MLNTNQSSAAQLCWQITESLKHMVMSLTFGQCIWKSIWATKKMLNVGCHNIPKRQFEFHIVGNKP
jgi:hypothetical protein